MKPLDFLIIGAQKCATTALFEHLRNHPDVEMPLEKEVPFFTGDDCSSEAWKRFSAKQFGGDTQGKFWGKATPQYMCDSRAAQNIKALMPDVKLIAILRDPIERTWSHYQMGRRRDTEQRDFSDALYPLLKQVSKSAGESTPVPEHAAGYQSEADFYVAWSEYGRALSGFAQLFDSSQILVLYAEDLERDPQKTLDTLLEFIGLSAGYRPSSLGKVIHRGGGSKRIPQSLRASLTQWKWLFRLWQLVPPEQQGRLRFRYEQWNVRSKTTPMSVPAALEHRLRVHFGEDLKALCSLGLARPPWLDKYRGST